MNFGQNLYQWFLSNAQSLVLMSIVVIGIYLASHGDCTPRPFQKKASDPRSDPRATVGKVVLP